MFKSSRIENTLSKSKILQLPTGSLEKNCKTVPCVAQFFYFFISVLSALVYMLEKFWKLSKHYPSRNVEELCTTSPLQKTCFLSHSPEYLDGWINCNVILLTNISPIKAVNTSQFDSKIPDIQVTCTKYIAFHYYHYYATSIISCLSFNQKAFVKH